APVVDQHPASVPGRTPGLHDDLPERQAPEGLDRMDVDRVQTGLPHGVIVPPGTTAPGGLSTRGTADCSGTDPGTARGPAAEPRAALPRTRRAEPDAAAAAGGRGSRAARWPAAGCTRCAPAAAGRAA